MKILITGAAGNVGKQLSKYLRSKGHKVFGIDIVQGVGDNYRVADINNPIDMLDVFESFDPEYCYHLAAMVSRVTCELSPAITVQTNISGTINIIQLCRIYKTKLIFFSTSEVYGNIEGELSEERTDLAPNNFYGLTKLMGEQLVKYAMTKGLEAIIVRPFMLYHEDETHGDHRSAMIRFITDLMAGKKITVHQGSGRSWMHMDDACNVLEILLQRPFNITINIGSPVYIHTKDMAVFICALLGKDPSECIEYVQLPEGMTLSKKPDLDRMFQLTGIRHMTVPVGEGIKKLIKKLTS